MTDTIETQRVDGPAPDAAAGAPMLVPERPSEGELEQPSAPVASVVELSRLRDEHNAIVEEIGKVEATDLTALDAEKRAEVFADLDAKYARVQDVRERHSALEARQRVDLTPIPRHSTVSQRAVPSVESREGERRAYAFDEFRADPFGFWEAGIRRMVELQAGGPVAGDPFAALPRNFNFKLPGSGRLMFGPARRLPGFDAEYAALERQGLINPMFEFDDPGATGDAQEPTQGYFGRFGPTYSPYRAIGITPQVMAPGWRFQYLDGNISSGGPAPQAEGNNALARLVTDWGDEDVVLTTIGVLAQTSVQSIRTNSGFLMILEALLQDLTMRDVSDDIAQGDGQNNHLRGVPTAGRSITNNSVVVASTPGVNLVKAIYNAADGVEFSGGGMATHTLMRHEAVEDMRTERDDGGWIDQFPADNGRMRIRGTEVVPSSEFPAYSGTNRVGIVGDWNMGIFLARLGDIEVEVDGSRLFHQNQVEVRANCFAQVVIPIGEKFETLSRAA